MNEYFAESLGILLENISKNISNRMILEHLEKHGQINLEEATFYTNLVQDVITEAAEDFIPDEIDNAPVEGDDNAPVEGDDNAPVEVFYDQAGNAYTLVDGQMIPVDGGADASNATENDNIDSDSEDAENDKAESENTPVQESDSSVANNKDTNLLEESDNIVAKILANLN